MSKFLASVAAGTLLASVAAFGAQAFPIQPSSAPSAALDVTLVAGGCGIGLHRGPHGGCRRNVVVAAPVVVAPVAPVVTVCPLGTHPGPYGHRCFAN
jgi:hypothetical protein